MSGRNMTNQQVQQLQDELAKLVNDPQWRHKITVVGMSKRTKLKWWVNGRVRRVQCWYWWNLGRLQAKLGR